MWKNVMVFVVFAVVGLAGCDECDLDATRCNGDRAEVCNADGRWELGADCSDIEDFGVGIVWGCCLDPKDGLHSCLPVEECSGE